MPTWNKNVKLLTMPSILRNVPIYQVTIVELRTTENCQHIIPFLLLWGFYFINRFMYGRLKSVVSICFWKQKRDSRLVSLTKKLIPVWGFVLWGIHCNLEWIIYVCVHGSAITWNLLTLLCVPQQEGKQPNTNGISVCAFKGWNIFLVCRHSQSILSS
jgi:hypothetical protein